MKRPALDGTTLDVARTDHHVDIIRSSHFLQQRGKLPRIVAEVTIKVEEERVTAIEGTGHRESNRTAEPPLITSNLEVNASIVLPQLGDQVARAIGRIVIDNEQIGLGDGRSDCPD